MRYDLQAMLCPKQALDVVIQESKMMTMTAGVICLHVI
jgi:hypothetical protein